jgi:hypothetical protein
MLMRLRLQRFAVGTLALAALASRATAIEVLIPSYFYPSGVNNGWPQLNTAASSVAVTAILNPASGPGPSLDTTYRSAVNSLRANGGRVIGYVSTSYAARPIADVKADIAKYKSLYTIDGIFLDEMTNTNDAAALAYYREVYSYIKTLDPNWRVTANPGTNTTPAYLQSPGTTDALVTFESNAGYAAATPSGWTANYATRRFSNLPYAVSTSATMVSYVNAAATTKRSGYIYITDDSGANPWDRLPTYWATELDAIRAVTSTWNSSTSGDWNAAGAWTTPSAPDGIGAEALLFGMITSAQTVYTNTDLTLGVLAFNNANRYLVTGGGSLTMDASVELALIDVRRGNHTINLPLTLRDATVASVAEGASLTIADPLTIEVGASLTKTGLGTMSIVSTVSDANATLAVASGRLSIEAEASLGVLTIAPGANVELAAGASLTLHDRSSTSIHASIAFGHLTSAASDDRHGLGYVALDDGTFVLKLAMNGDTNLDGSVDFSDLTTFAAQFGRTTDATWSAGDFNYNGFVDRVDLGLLEANYGAPKSFAADWQLAQSRVPEPIMLLFSAMPVVFARRLRR